MIQPQRPAFMTPAMWFVWLLRADICSGAAIDDSSAQREFVAWWLLFGRSEYPAAWSYGQAQIDVAMEPVAIGDGLRLPRYLRRLHEARNDLQQNFTLASDADIATYLCWYRMFAPLELAASPKLGAGELAATEADIDGLPRMAVCLSRWVPALRAAADPAARPRFATWYHEYGARLLPPPREAPAATPEAVRPGIDPGKHGVNLIGFARAESGLGEDVRSLSRALRATRIPHAVIDVPAGPAIRQQDGSLRCRLRTKPVCPISIFCMPAFDMAALLLARGKGFFAGQYRIGWWPWELAEFPPSWSEVFDLVDEIWAPSVYAAQAYLDSGKPVFVMPPAVTIPRSILASRRGHRSEESQPYRFIYPFDIASHLSRKNPLAAVRAFKAAFAPEDDSVTLVLRMNGDPASDPAWPPIAAEAAEDPRIMILPGTLARDDALAVMAACDCLVSPHRAEGFGRNIAEALLLGLEVLATGFSGCLDYLEPDECVAFSPAVVAAGAYPFAVGMHWADPDHDHLVARMRTVRAQPKSLAARRARAAAFAETHAPLAVGRMVSARLASLTLAIR